MSDAVSREAVLKAVYDWEEDWNSIYSAVLHLPAMSAKHDFAQLEALTAERDRLRHAIMFWLEAQEPDVNAAINMMRAALKGETP